MNYNFNYMRDVTGYITKVNFENLKKFGSINDEWSTLPFSERKKSIFSAHDAKIGFL